jgi:CheY-like chemotaxis protein
MPDLRPKGFLSYTHKDDEFFGGYITEFRKMLENAVHVVSGERAFELFQDSEGIVIGNNWRKRLSEAIDDSSFLVPMLTPLYFNSGPCREELTEFLEHERSLERDDLMLPVYFVTSAKLEKPEEQARDPLAVEVARRQVYDWREQALIPLQEGTSRKAMIALAGQIADRIQAGTLPGSEDSVVPPGPVGIGQAPDPGEGTSVPRRPPSRRRAADLAGDPKVHEGVDGAAARTPPPLRAVLWVDDLPANNAWERRALESYGVRFELARDTSEAMALMEAHGPFAAIISDLGREGEPAAGLTLLRELQRSGQSQAPYFIYTSPAGTAVAPVARALGSRAVTADPDELVRMVIDAIR